MRKSLVRVVLGCAVVGGLATLWVIPSYAKAPQVPGTLAQPGMSPAQVWINNRLPTEAIPVHLIPDANGSPMLVSVRGVTPVSFSGAVAATASRQSWEYRSVVVPSDNDLAPALNGLGADGWEAVGITAQPGAKTAILLKRPK